MDFSPLSLGNQKWEKALLSDPLSDPKQPIHEWWVKVILIRHRIKSSWKVILFHLSWIKERTEMHAQLGHAPRGYKWFSGLVPERSTPYKMCPQMNTRRWSPENEFCCIAHCQHRGTFLLLGAPSHRHSGRLHTGQCSRQVGGGCSLYVYAMPKIYICSSGSILEKYLHFSCAFPLFFFFCFLIWAFSSCICFKWEKTAYWKPKKWLFPESKKLGESKGSK